MKLRKILALTLALVLTFSALSVVSFAAEPVDISTCTVEEVKEQKHTGSAITPTLVVKTAGDEPTTLVKDTDYTVEFKNNTNYGTATYTVKGKGNYTGTKTGSFEIVPNTPVDGVDYLDTDTKSTKDIDQKYDATVTTVKTDVEKVQISWKITDIAASVTVNKIWDPDTLTWIDDKNNANTATADPVTAEFDFTNLSSLRLKGEVKFAAAGSFKPEVEYSDKVVALLSKADDAECDNTAKITVTLTPDDKDFSTYTKDEKGTYGTYTVSIAAPDYLTFKATAVNSSVTPKFISGTWEYSTDNGKTWSAGANDGSTVIKLAKVNDAVIMRGDACTTKYKTGFSMEGSIAASGEITSITNGVGGDASLNEAAYQHMFIKCTALTTAPKLPSTTLSKNCYMLMFDGCTNLVTAPELPAEKAVSSCYASMFMNCSSLTIAPKLPATELADSCYGGMFYGCTSLTTAPELPAKTLAGMCYNNMFYGCSSLTTAPELPAETLADGCYNGMFISCTKLTKVPNLPAKTLVDNCYFRMFKGCSGIKIATTQQTGTCEKIFTCPSTTDLTNSVKDMFSSTGGTFTGTPSADTTYYWYIAD